MRIDRDLDICRSIECSGRSGARFPYDRTFALQLLRPLKGDSFAISALRMLLLQELGYNDLYRVSDDTLIELASDLLVSRRLHYHAQPPSLGSGGSGSPRGSSSAAQQPASPAFSRPQGKPPSPATTSRAAFPVQDPPTFPPDTNAAAQAATLRTAAELGAPFCEVCAARH
jgi:hypothetical protein